MEQLGIASRYLQANDPYLAKIIAQTPHPPPLVAHTNYYQVLIESIIGQQLSVKAAAAIEARFKALFDNHFPTPEQILACDIEDLRSAGLSRPKARYVQDLARHIISGDIRFDTLDSLSNEAIIEELTRVKGIGEWTVHMFLIFCMGRLDVLPTGDLGIRNSIKKLYNLKDIPAPDDIKRIARKYHWAPLRISRQLVYLAGSRQCS